MSKHSEFGVDVLCQVSADVVIGADGVRSKARELVLGYFDKPKSSGYAVYRAWYVGNLVLERGKLRPD